MRKSRPMTTLAKIVLVLELAATLLSIIDFKKKGTK